MRLLTILLVEVLNPLLVISIALFVGVGYILTLLMPVNISHWQMLFWVTLLLPLGTLLIRANQIWKRDCAPSARSAWKRFLPLLPLLIFIPVFGAELTYPNLQLPGHGDLHAGFVFQLLHGSTPIDNVFVPGYPANYYWLYHAYLAALVSITNLSVPTVGSIVNLIAILSSLLWIGQTLIVLGLASARTVKLGLLAILVYCSVNMTGVITLIGQILDDANVLRTLRFMLLEGADRRLHSVLAKALNFGSMTLGLLFFVAALYACIVIVQRKANLLALVLISASGIAAMAMQQVAAFYIVMVLLGGVFLTALVFFIGSKDKSSWALSAWRELTNSIRPALLALWLATSFCLSLPLLIYFERFAGANQNGLSLTFFSRENIAMIVAALLLYSPFLLVQTVYVWRRDNSAERLIQKCCLLSLLLTSNLVLLNSNQYKGVYFVAILMAISTLFGLKLWSASSNSFLRNFSRLVLAVFLCLTFARIVWVSHFHLQKGSQEPFSYDGMHLLYRTDENNQMAAYYWIRDQTPPESIVIWPVQTYRYTNAFHERLPYVKKKQDLFTDNIPAYDERVETLSRFYSEDTSPDQYQMLLAKMLDDLPDRPFYAVVRDAEISPQVMAERGAKLAFKDESDDTNVYWLNPQ